MSKPHGKARLNSRTHVSVNFAPQGQDKIAVGKHPSLRFTCLTRTSKELHRLRRAPWISRAEKRLTKFHRFA